MFWNGRCIYIRGIPLYPVVVMVVMVVTAMIVVNVSSGREVGVGSTESRGRVYSSTYISTLMCR